MSVNSAGLLPYRLAGAGVEVLIAHLGGPFWSRRDERAWSIVKGELEEGEEPLQAALREFGEETGLRPPERELLALGEVRQSAGKLVTAWAVEAGELDPASLRPGTFSLEWPPRSGRTQEFPEIDRAEWCAPELARRRLIAGQVPLLERLEQALAAQDSEGSSDSSTRSG